MWVCPVWVCPVWVCQYRYWWDEDISEQFFGHVQCTMMTSLIKVHIMYMYTCVKLFTTHTCSSRVRCLVITHTCSSRVWCLVSHLYSAQLAFTYRSLIARSEKHVHVHCTSYGKVLVSVFLSMTYVLQCVCTYM